ncbi:DNA-binding protein [Streptomyces sp. NPDC048568]|uniref:MmyB family transcriptional regulator n=1 Tax=Streptomyces sp. NPDC048568 TaxID=3365571 RepID=UPI003717FDB7
MHAPMFDSPTTDRHGRPDFARYHFPDDTSHDFFIDWDSGAEAGREPHDRPLRELIGELSTLSQDFRTLWAAHDVRIRHDGVKRLQHPDVGELELTYQSVDLPVSQRAVHDLSLYTAGPGGTSEGRLKLLAGLAATRTPTPKPTDQRRSGPAVRPDAVATCASHSATVAGLVPSRSAMT